MPAAINTASDCLLGLVDLKSFGIVLKFLKRSDAGFTASMVENREEEEILDSERLALSHLPVYDDVLSPSHPLPPSSSNFLQLYSPTPVLSSSSLTWISRPCYRLYARMIDSTDSSIPLRMHSFRSADRTREPLPSRLSPIDSTRVPSSSKPNERAYGHRRDQFVEQLWFGDSESTGLLQNTYKQGISPSTTPSPTSTSTSTSTFLNASRLLPHHLIFFFSFRIAGSTLSTQNRTQHAKPSSDPPRSRHFVVILKDACDVTALSKARWEDMRFFSLTDPHDPPPNATGDPHRMHVT
ncbi:hypothetical protein M378DRAFT_7792 [Amanita muscaria Koide BX008]|uniref:Uncharacterized protein n=1 Tax=Amanita muscaria (strain Koide BX008) TaxID=946122 RepID=A0A0C2SZU5_AMAMK|nr:hypothetical protein M378DRAFT_7792 [Amanita muscaria Koide BX008]